MAYRAQVPINRNGKTVYQESQAFDRNEITRHGSSATNPPFGAP